MGKKRATQITRNNTNVSSSDKGNKRNEQGEQRGSKQVVWKETSESISGEINERSE